MTRLRNQVRNFSGRRSVEEWRALRDPMNVYGHLRQLLGSIESATSAGTVYRLDPNGSHGQ